MEEKKNFDFWQDHSETYLEMALRTDRCERIENPDAYGKNTGDCGDSVEFFLTVRNGRINRISFDMDGCMNTRACANTVAELLEGKPVHTGWGITAERVAAYLETLPEASYHCAELAVGALYRALHNHGELEKSPWKRRYT